MPESMARRPQRSDVGAKRREIGAERSDCRPQGSGIRAGRVRMPTFWVGHPTSELRFRTSEVGHLSCKALIFSAFRERAGAEVCRRRVGRSASGCPARYWHRGHCVWRPASRFCRSSGRPGRCPHRRRIVVWLGTEPSHVRAASAESHERALPLSCMSQVSSVGMTRMKSHSIR